jgi:hypothetical protein
MNFIKRFFFVILIALILSACGSQNPEKISGTFYVPSYATSKSIMDEVDTLLSLNFKDSYFNGPTFKYDQELDLEKLNNDGRIFVGVFIDPAQLTFAEKQFEDYGQTCKVEKKNQFLVREYNLVVDVTPSIDSDKFFEFCSSKIPDSVLAIVVEATQGDGNIKITFSESVLPVKVKLSE